MLSGEQKQRSWSERRQRLRVNLLDGTSGGRKRYTPPVRETAQPTKQSVSTSSPSQCARDTRMKREYPRSSPPLRWENWRIAS